MERFLRYSLERGRAIRLIYQDGEGKMRQVSAQVTALAGGSVSFTTLRPRRDVTLSMSHLLSADYRKGDEGQE